MPRESSEKRGKHKELGKADKLEIIETEFLKSGIASNPGPTGEVIEKLARYRKWTFNFFSCWYLIVNDASLH